MSAPTPPTTPFGWDLNGVNMVQPPSGLVNNGWAVGAAPPSSYFNYWMAAVANWLLYFVAWIAYFPGEVATLIAAIFSTNNAWTAEQDFTVGSGYAGKFAASGDALSGLGGVTNAAVGGIGAVGGYFVGGTTGAGAGTGIALVLKGNATRGGALFLGLSADPSTPVPGEVYFNSSTGHLKYYNGSTWVPL